MNAVGSAAFIVFRNTTPFELAPHNSHKYVGLTLGLRTPTLACRPPFLNFLSATLSKVGPIGGRTGGRVGAHTATA